MAVMAAEYPFVGREDVLGELRAALEHAASGRGRLVTLIGPEGAGKTRTAEEAAAHADAFRIRWTCCPPHTAGRAFRPWSRLLRELVTDDARCGRLVTASPPLRALVAGSAPAVLGGADPETARLRRVRRTGSQAERARTAVTARIRASVRRIGAVHPELGRHLDTALRTGTLCVYQPEQPPEWSL